MKILITVILITSSIVCFGQDNMEFKNNYAFLTEKDLSKEQVEGLVREFRQHIFNEAEKKFDLKFQYSDDGKLDLFSKLHIEKKVFISFLNSNNYEISMIESTSNALTERSSF